MANMFKVISAQIYFRTTMFLFNCASFLCRSF